MTFSTKIRLGFLASAVALAFAAPSAFADAGKTVRGIRTDQGGALDATAASHSEQVMKKTSARVKPHNHNEFHKQGALAAEPLPAVAEAGKPLHDHGKMHKQQ
jgi:hypothetical protein